MKLKKLASICNSHKRVDIYEQHLTDGEVKQFISDGGAIYPIYGLPRLDKENLLTIFDIAPEDWEKWRVNIKSPPLGYCLDDVTEDGEDEAVEVFYNPVVMNISALKPVKTSVGTVFYQDKYLDPVKDADQGIQFYVRYTPKGNPYIVIKSGLFLQAVISECRPEEVHVRRMEEMLRSYAQRMGWDMKPIFAGASESEQLNIWSGEENKT